MITHYYIKSCYINNRTGFIMSILGCINREINKLKKNKDDEHKLHSFAMALDSLSRCLMTVLIVEKNPDAILGMYDCLEATQRGSLYSKIQEEADRVTKFLEDNVEIHFTGPFGEITTEFVEWLPDFKGKIRILFE